MEKHSNVFYIRNYNKEPVWEPIKDATALRNKYGLDLFRHDGKISEGTTGLKLCDDGDLDIIVEKHGIEKIKSMIEAQAVKTGTSPRYTTPDVCRENIFGPEEKQEPAKLMKPLFIDGMFNRSGKRIRARYLKTIACDGAEYKLWISDGKPENDYPRAENDKYYLMVEANDYLVPSGYTEYDLEQRASYDHMVKKLYGNQDEREKYFEQIRSEYEHKESNLLIDAKMKEEDNFIATNAVSDEVLALYLKQGIDGCIEQYIDARDHGGKFANFQGAAFLGELDECDRIATKLKEIRKQEDIIKRAAIEEQRKREDEKKIAEELASVADAESTFINGGKIDSGDMIVKLADKYEINIPLRTRGWILKTFAECTFENGDIKSVRYYKSKNGNGSTKIYDVLRNIMAAIKSVGVEVA